VAFDTGGIRQWLRHDVSGLLVPPSDGDRGMATALAALLDKPDLRERLSRGAVARAREMSLDAHVDGLERVLLSAARRPPTTAHEAPAHR
jgi:glycosyltransferase involved in cell wall biosynthesis